MLPPEDRVVLAWRSPPVALGRHLVFAHTGHAADPQAHRGSSWWSSVTDDDPGDPPHSLPSTGKVPGLCVSLRPSHLQTWHILFHAVDMSGALQRERPLRPITARPAL